MALCATGRFGVTEPNGLIAECLRRAKTFANRKELSMISTAETLRRGLYAVFAASAAGGASVAALLGNPAPSATAATDPCAASELAKTIGSVATSMGYY